MTVTDDRPPTAECGCEGSSHCLVCSPPIRLDFISDCSCQPREECPECLPDGGDPFRFVPTTTELAFQACLEAFAR